MVRSLYALTHGEKLALGSKNFDGENRIVATGPWIKGSNELPHRIVLREGRDELIVHLQVIDVELGHAFFTHGNYYTCPLSVDKGQPLTAAWTRFEDRVRRGLDIGPRPHPQPEEDFDED